MATKGEFGKPHVLTALVPAWLREAAVINKRYRGHLLVWKLLEWVFWVLLVVNIVVPFAIIKGWDDGILVEIVVLALLCLVGLPSLILDIYLNGCLRLYGGRRGLKKRVRLFRVMLRYEECLERLGPRQGESDMRYFQMEHGYAFLQDAQDALQKHQPTFGHYLRLGEGCIKEVERGFLG